jgi:Txe/YoeB family toxin of Txe-Axe toxin-antitoxin module
MRILYLQKAIEDLNYWKNSGNKIVIKKIVRGIKNIRCFPYLAGNVP